MGDWVVHAASQWLGQVQSVHAPIHVFTYTYTCRLGQRECFARNKLLGLVRLSFPLEFHATPFHCVRRISFQVDGAEVVITVQLDGGLGTVEVRNFADFTSHGLPFAP